MRAQEVRIMFIIYYIILRHLEDVYDIMCVCELWKYDIRCAISCCCHHITRAAVRFAEKLLCAPENRRGARVALYYYCRTQNARAFSNNAMMHSRVPFGGQKKKEKTTLYHYCCRHRPAVCAGPREDRRQPVVDIIIGARY